MALNINTNITNNLDGYLLDAKNVKGTYVVVQYYESLANLPSECVVEGSLAYVSWSSNSLRPVGFYQYVSNQWTYSQRLNQAIDYNGIDNAMVTMEDDFDITETYSVEIPNIDGIGATALTNLENSLKYYCKVSFSLGEPELYMKLDNVEIDAYRCSCIYVYNNKPYFALMSINKTGTVSNEKTTFTGSLSFQEIEGGSGGGTGEAVGTLWYQHLFTLHDAYNGSDVRVCLTMPKDASSTILQLVNAQLSTNYTTIDELVEAINQAITYQLITVGQIVGLIGFISDISDNPTNCLGTFCLHSVDPTYWYQLLNASNDGTIIAVAGASSSGSGGTQYVLQNKYQLDLPSSIDIEVTPLGNATGGGSSTGGGSGDKIYTYKITFPNANFNSKQNEFIFSLSENSLKDNALISGMEQAIGTSFSLDTLVNTFNSIETSSSYMKETLISLFIICSSDCFLNNWYQDSVEFPIEPIISKVVDYTGGAGFVVNYTIDTGSSTQSSGIVSVADPDDLTMSLVGTVGGGSGSGITETGIDYMQVSFPNGQLYLTFAKGCFEGQIATDLNSAIATINSSYGISIPNFEGIESWKTIYDYLTGLGSSYVALAVMWLSVFFETGCYFALSQKCMYNGEYCPVSIEAIADIQNQIFSYTIKYLSANSSPLAFAEATSSSNYVQLTMHVNELD